MFYKFLSITILALTSLNIKAHGTPFMGDPLWLIAIRTVASVILVSVIPVSISIFIVRRNFKKSKKKYTTFALAASVWLFYFLSLWIFFLITNRIGDMLILAIVFTFIKYSPFVLLFLIITYFLVKYFQKK